MRDLRNFYGFLGECCTVTCDKPFGVLASILFYVRFTLELTLDFSLIKLPKIPTPEKGKYFVGSPNFSPSGERGGGDIPIAPISSLSPLRIP